MFSCEFCEIVKNIFFTEHLLSMLLEVNQWNISSLETVIGTSKIIHRFKKATKTLYLILNALLLVSLREINVWH